jgi:hypothetical protein
LAGQLVWRGRGMISGGAGLGGSGLGQLVWCAVGLCRFCVRFCPLFVAKTTKNVGGTSLGAGAVAGALP